MLNKQPRSEYDDPQSRAEPAKQSVLLVTMGSLFTGTAVLTFPFH